MNSGDGPLPMAIFELLEYIVNEVSDSGVHVFRENRGPHRAHEVPTEAGMTLMGTRGVGE